MSLRRPKDFDLALLSKLIRSVQKGDKLNPTQTINDYFQKKGDLTLNSCIYF